MAAPNGLASLAVLDAHEAVLAAGFPTPNFEISNGRGKRLAGMSTTSTVPGRPDPVTIRRPDLYRALLAETRAAGIPVEHGKRLIRIDELDDGVRARLADGTTTTTRPRVRSPAASVTC